MSDKISRIVTITHDSVNPSVTARRRVNLNTATQVEIEGLPMVDLEVAAALIAARPFRGWDDLVRVKGFYLALVEDLRSGGAEIK